jgi:hypothetical protein
MVGKVLIRKVSRTAQPSKIQAADQPFDGASQLAGHVLEDLPQSSDSQRLVGRNREVLLLAVST